MAENKSPFFDVWHALCDALDKGLFNTATQAVALNLLNEFNKHRFRGSIALSDRELQEMAQIRSNDVLTDAKRRIKNAGIFTFKIRKGKSTVYMLGEKITQPAHD